MAAKQEVKRLLLQVGDKKKEKLDYDQAVQRSLMAESFVAHPYWEVMANMLSKTISAETESMLESDEHLAMNRASVAMCRKTLKMPYIDIEQGKAAIAAFEESKRRFAARFGQERGASARG